MMHSGDVMELEKLYTDVSYASKKEVADKMGVHLIEPVWKQIVQYRHQWMVQLNDVEICLCPGIMKMMMTLNELLFQINEVELDALYPVVLTETGKWMMHHFLKTEGSFEARLHQLCLLYHQDEQSILEVHQRCSYALLFVLWCFLSYGQSEFGVLLVILKLKCTGMSVLLSLLEVSDFSVHKQQDMTYCFDACLKRWVTKAQKSVLSYSYEKHDEHLVYLYPQLKKHQIQFYLEHHAPGHYYTIEQFIEYSDVCYETGRTALEQLVALGFYTKLKQGKKFVYTAC